MRQGLFRNEFTRFLAVGFTSVAIDYIAYRALLAFELPIPVSKASGYVTGAIFGYFANRIFTFRVAEHWRLQELIRFIAVYLFALGANVAANTAVIEFLGRNELGIAIGFLIATGISATLNYLGMKRFVFVARPQAGAESP